MHRPADPRERHDDIPHHRTGPEADGTTYGAVSRLNHWAVALLILGVLGAGLAIEYLPLADGTRGRLLGWHKSLDLAVLPLAFWRLGWRLWQGFPQPASLASPRTEAVARVLHWSLLGATILMPLSGTALTIFDGRSIELAGSLTIPALGEFAFLAAAAETVHALVGMLLVAMIGLHPAAALKHHFLDGDATLPRRRRGRMIPELSAGIDFVLVDLWKDLYEPCLEAFLPKLHPGAILVADNMIKPVGEGVARYAISVRSRSEASTIRVPVGSGLDISTVGSGPAK